MPAAATPKFQTSICGMKSAMPAYMAAYMQGIGL
jgi:hypothetical protein